MTKALIIVDMVKGFINKKTKDGPCAMYLKGADRIVPFIEREIHSLKPKDTEIWVCDTHKPNDKEFERFPPHCIEGTEESKPIEIPYKGRHVVIPKTRYSGFYVTSLDNLLQMKKVTEVTIVGVCTDICVFATALDAFYHGYKVTVVKDCIYALEVGRGEMCLKYLKDLAGVKVR